MVDTNRDYVDFLIRRYRFVLVAVAAGLATAAIFCVLLPKRYTATATLLIEPPGTGDPRISTAVSPAYLESLKSFEQLASSDTLFLRTCERFNLLADGASSADRLKRRILRVEKVKDTRLMHISVTLRDKQSAQAVAQYLAEQTELLNRSLALEGDKELADDLARQTGSAKGKLEAARTAAAGLTGRQSQLEAETLALRDLKAQTKRQALEAAADAADYSAEESTPTSAENPADVSYVRQKAAGARARQASLAASELELERQLAAKEEAWVASISRFQSATSEVANAEATFNEIRKRANDMTPSAGLRSEQIRIVDRGIVPERPSSPDIPLILASALMLSFMAAFLFLTLQYRLSPPSRRSVREFRVAHVGR